MSDEKNDYPSSKFQRTSLIAKTGIKMGVTYASHVLRHGTGKEKMADAHRQSASQLFTALTQLRGPALKAAQAIGMDTGILPTEFTEILSQAQYRVPPINKMMVRAIIKQELGGWPEAVFESFEPEATAAASIGQVHYAVLKDGTPVAVKVQYPGVRDTIEGDLAVARPLVRQFVGKDRADYYFEEVRSKLLEETDYTNEGRQIREFRADFPQPWIEIPEWKESISTHKVLVMERLNGRHLDSLTGETQAANRVRFGQMLWDFFHLQISTRYKVHADTHPGNYLLTDKGNLGILDFGCVKRYEPAFFDRYIALMPVHLKNDSTRALQLYQELEMIFPDKPDQKPEQEFADFCLHFGSDFVEPYRHSSFDFSDISFRDKLFAHVLEIKKFGEPRGSKHFIYTTRTHLGLYQMLFKLGVTLSTESGLAAVKAFLEEVRPQEAALLH